jgi:hypothetical protein
MKALRVWMGLFVCLTAVACGGGGDGDGTSVFSLQVGDCFNDEGTGLDQEMVEVAAVPTVPCEDPHDNEVFLVDDITLSGAYPGDEEIYLEASDLCLAAFAGYVGRDYESSQYDVFPLTPTRQGWNEGDREVVCALYNLDLSQMTGSARSSGL